MTLDDGEYRENADGGSSGDLRIRFVEHAAGDLDGDGDEDAAVVLVEEAGSDRLYRVHALLADGDSLRDVASRLLGDRIEVRGVRIVDDLIATDLVIRSPGEPVSAPPTVPATLGFALTGKGLFPIDRPTSSDPGRPSDVPDPAARLGAADWVLSGLDREEGAERLAQVARVPRLRFTPELVTSEESRGRLSGFSGCNRVFASYRASPDGSLRVTALARTRRACEGPALELERLLLGALETVDRFSFEGDELLLRGGAGVLRLRAATAPPEDPLGPAPREGEGEERTPRSQEADRRA